MHSPQSWRVYAFGGGDPLSLLPQSPQVAYLLCYLTDLGAAHVLEEPNYFDRDYLAEFSAFYGQSARGYPNLCRRLLFFGAGASDPSALIDLALGGDSAAEHTLQESFMGFVVLRPIPTAPLGRTVLAWYPDHPEKPARAVDPSREYSVHLAGLRLCVKGLAWQQQDTGVSACATIALWSMLHSRAFHEQHMVPTTASITMAAHRTSPWGSRVFPSDGLIQFQLLEALKELGFGPIVMQGDVSGPGVRNPLFSKERFCGSLAAAIRSGYPVLLSGKRDGQGHAVCAVGFRASASSGLKSGDHALADRDFDALYLHDDNLGPSVRFEVQDYPGLTSAIQLVAAAPPPRAPRPVPNPTDKISPFVPDGLIIAVHPDVRTTPDHVHKRADGIAVEIKRVVAALESAWLKKLPEPPPVSGNLGVEIAVRFFKVREYLAAALPTAVSASNVTARVRRQLCELASPMSLHVAVARFVINGKPFGDVLFDTTDNMQSMHAFARVSFNPLAKLILESLRDLGATITAY
jgi:hypothetical protein